MNHFDEIYKNRSILVTGDTGFKGSWLVAWLSHMGAKVTGYALPPLTDQDNFVTAGLGKVIDHVDGDIRDLDAMKIVFARCKPEMVFHLAAQPLVLESYKSPRETFETNVMGTVNILEAARLSPGIRAIVNITTDKVYDNKESMYGYKECDPLGGKDPYSASKAGSELVTASYRDSFFCKGDAAALATARAGNVIGGGDWADFRIVPDCIRSLQKRETIIVRNPDAVRPWQHVLEALRGYLHLGSLLLLKGRQYAGAWNFGPRQETIRPVGSVVDGIIKAWGSGSSEIRRDPNAVHEANLLHLDISKAVQELGWKPALDFNQTMQMTVDQYRRMSESKADVLAVMLDEIEKYMTIADSEKN